MTAVQLHALWSSTRGRRKWARSSALTWSGNWWQLESSSRRNNWWTNSARGRAWRGFVVVAVISLRWRRQVSRRDNSGRWTRRASRQWSRWHSWGSTFCALKLTFTGKKSIVLPCVSSANTLVALASVCLLASMSTFLAFLLPFLPSLNFWIATNKKPTTVLNLPW